MARIVFTPNIQRVVECEPKDVEGATLREVLEAALRGNERARSYLLDDQGAVRKHIVIFINGVQALDRDVRVRRVPAHQRRRAGGERGRVPVLPGLGAAATAAVTPMIEGHVSPGFEPVRTAFEENFTRRQELGGMPPPAPGGARSIGL